ncbi:LysM peptidoglycan-binding domain-containing protein [Caproiciproducens faecalis]|uniref:LysM peptidoglycan-binding domain-containing protein n=1 Tax=Caproiciproducens faecalis TaxID=2820301 RepID=A0ABS7DQF2_9FIRM|nr:LysM peptidoglycan-binding domain-containing protein [Caproiciproducens faecalis]MBW7573519.1 LysM peptidoglycan-binding domain-containing protein [Caproiciproducens faecalis]
MVIHVVRQGDSVYSLSSRYGVSIQKIIADNSLEDTERLMIGQAIVVDADSVNHTVTPGESLYSIARRYNTTVFRILSANPSITDPSKIKAGQVIIIPLSAEKLGTIDVNGYAFPNINTNVLENTLPNLTYLSIFSYQVRPDGSLAPIQDTPLIEAARRYNVGPMMVITNIKEGASFNSELAHTILTNPDIQNTLLENIVRTLNEKKYFGLDIDFEYIFPRDKDLYTGFIKKVTDRLHPLGYTVTTALAPKTSEDQPGLLYEAHDYGAHGALVDHVILMTYEWGYTYGPPRAVAPVNLVEDVLQYAVTVIPSKKILMGIPNYGYDWTLPFVQGSSARSLTNPGAVSLASRVGAQILFDTKAQSPFFNYYENGKQHVVWFEDARSIQAKLELVDKYDLGGVSYWTINSFFPQNWIVLNSMYNIRKVR